MRLSRRFSKFFYFLIIFIFLCITYIEVFTYYFNTRNWLAPTCKHRKECTKILLVADPQIIGNYKEILHFLTPFSIFDSDRYVRKTYTLAYDFVQPDVVIFLGDLMDEGYTATDEEFNRYVRRIFNIFLDVSQGHVQHIWLPGDNDIGGEENRVLPHKLKRFERAFAQPYLISVKNITFFKVNRLTQNMPIFKDNREFYDTNKLFIGLSHVPLMFQPSLFVDKVIKKMLPQLIFTGHEHKSMIISTDALLREDFHIVPLTPENNAVFEYTLGVTDMYEILIPTCSYRMGTKKIGYGFAVLENNDLRFTVLWSPSRFEQLQSYLILLMCCVLLSLCFSFCLCRRGNR